MVTRPAAAQPWPAADDFGTSLASLGDLNGDGVTDLAVGAAWDDTGGTDRGAVYVLLMNSDGTAKSTRKIAHQAGVGPVLADSDLFGISVTALGDLNGDGITDLASGAAGDDTGGSSRGAVRILFLNPAPELNVSISGGSISENGGTTTATVTRSNTDTSLPLTVTLASSDLSEATVPATVTILAGQSVATFTIAGVDDPAADGTQVVTITATAAGCVSGSQQLNVTDDDVAGVTVNPISGLVTTEAGGAATFTVKLTSQPTANVTISLSSSDTTEGTVSPASLTFTAANWSTAPTVTVTGVDDVVFDGNVAFAIVTAAVTSSDTHYNGLNPADVSVTNQDDDPAPVDFGDAPDAYGTSLAANGARHEPVGPLLGTLRDSEPDAATPRDGSGDDQSGQDDEDGVVFTAPLRVGLSASVDVTASAAAVLNAWLDANADQDWSEPGEQIFVDQAVQAGVNHLTFTVPASGVATSQTFARFRLSTQAGLSPVGWAPDGEVEDQAVAIWPATSTLSGRKWNDLDGDGTQEAGEPGLSG